MGDSVQALPALRQRLKEEWPGPGPDKGYASNETFLSGHSAIDAYLGGGLRRGQLHEVFAADVEDHGSATGFAAMLALRGLQPGRAILWLRTLDAISKGGRFNPAGFAELGGDPALLFMAVAPDETALLRSAADAVRCDGFGVVVIECWGSPAILDLTASRRLTLAANGSGVTPVMLRLQASEQPSTADTRWSVRSVLSTPLEANAPGLPKFELTLLRRRSGPSGSKWCVEWDRDQRVLREPSQRARPVHSSTPVPGAVVSVPAGRPARHPWPIKRSA